MSEAVNHPPRPPLLPSASIEWFHVPLRLEDLPPQWQVTSLQKSIALLEMLAQAILLWFRPIKHSGGTMVQHCDNLPAVGSTAKSLASAEPYCYGLQAFSAVCIKRQVQAHLTHVAGERNEWADKLSRMNAEHSNFRGCLDATLEHKVDLNDFLSSMRL